MLSRRDAKVLLGAAAWTFYVWVSRVVIMLGQEESAGFKAVHLALAAVSLAFGVAIARIGLRAWRQSKEQEKEPSGL